MNSTHAIAMWVLHFYESTPSHFALWAFVMRSTCIITFHMEAKSHSADQEIFHVM
jgi:hypothetical protein